MKSSVERIIPIDPVSFLQFEYMTVDLWRVEAMSGASGQYVSPDPRFVIFFDGASILFDQTDGASTAGHSVLFVPAGMPLNGRLATVRCLEHIDIHVDEAWLRRIVGNSTRLDTALFLPISLDLERLCVLLAEECRQQKRPQGYAEALACCVIHEVFHLGRRQQAAKKAPVWLDQITEHVHNRLDTPPKIDELAKIAGMSRSRFSQRFKELAGQPPQQWIMDTRINEAQRLMMEGALLSQVAQETGFADQAHFSRCFRRATGIPPGRWVKRHNHSKT